MANMESFYGGRQGASFLLVYHFDCIEKNEDTLEYKKKIYANNQEGKLYLKEKAIEIDGNKEYVYDPIEKDGLNYKNKNYHWKTYTLDGHTTLDIEIIPDEEDPAPSPRNYYDFPIEQTESMLEVFQKGALSTSKVNYGEYVIIDTVEGLQAPDNPDNGKIFRRGLDINNGLYGAEYVGQIAGGQGPVGEPGGVHILGLVSSENDLEDEYPPELIFGEHPEYAGWVMIVGPSEQDSLYYMYYYDYTGYNPENECYGTWRNYGLINTVQPNNIITDSKDMLDSLLRDGFWLEARPLDYNPYFLDD